MKLEGRIRDWDKEPLESRSGKWNMDTDMSGVGASKRLLREIEVDREDWN